jgi:hypothetical protein
MKFNDYTVTWDNSTISMTERDRGTLLTAETLIEIMLI